MYAITPASYRTIADASDVQPGETAVDVIPASLLMSLQCAELRRQRDALLAACDWTMAADSPLNAMAKAAWATYRTALRNVPQQAGFPVTVDWPTAP